MNKHTCSPSKVEIEAALNDALQKGSIGLKVLAGLQLLHPDSIRQAFQTANEQKAYVAVHCGSTNNNSNIEVFLEAVQLAGNHKVHIAHINTYCRGLCRDEMQETAEAIEALVKHPNIRSESYLSPFDLE